MPTFEHYYFITAVTCHRHRMLGRLREGGVHLSPLGHLVTEAWNRIGQHRPWVSTGAFVVMPDHLHGILRWDHVPPNRRTSVAIIVGGFKGDATRSAHRVNLLESRALLWQRGFGAWRIRSPEALARAERYILENPVRGSRRDAVAYPESPRPDGRGSAPTKPSATTPAMGHGEISPGARRG